MESSAKIKVCLRLDADLFAAIDELKSKRVRKSRSAVVEEILHEWYEYQTQQQWNSSETSETNRLSFIKKARGTLKGASSLTEALLKARAEEWTREESSLSKPHLSDFDD